jgi:hypothetical protein
MYGLKPVPFTQAWLILWSFQLVLGAAEENATAG